MNTGSIMEVRNLFFNVPARKKFLKTTSREGSLVNDIVTRIALSYPDISFKLFNNMFPLLGESSEKLMVFINLNEGGVYIISYSP